MELSKKDFKRLMKYLKKKYKEADIFEWSFEKDRAPLSDKNYSKEELKEPRWAEFKYIGGKSITLRIYENKYDQRFYPENKDVIFDNLEIDIWSYKISKKDWYEKIENFLKQ